MRYVLCVRWCGGVWRDGSLSEMRRESCLWCVVLDR